MSKRVLVFAIFVGLGTASLPASDQIPAPPQAQPVAIVGATLHPVSGAVVEGGTVVFEAGKITAIGRGVSVPDNATVIEASGKHVYPGLIDAFTAIGLSEVSSVRGTRDGREAGTINPNARAEVSVNPGSEIIPVTRANGIALALTVPSGGTISGTSALLRLDGWTWEDLTMKAPVGMHVNWPNMTISTSRWVRQSEEEQKSARSRALTALDDAFSDARAYRKARMSESGAGARDHLSDLRWEAMMPVFGGDLPVIVSANNIQQIQAAVAWADAEGIELIILGGADAWRVSDLLVAHDVPVIVTGTHRTPSRRWEDFDAPFTVPAKLYKAGVKFCISSGMSWGGTPTAASTRNLPYHAGTAAAYGLPAEEALKAVTLYAAEILGIADRAGSLAEGKDATLIITDGDPLEIPTHVERMFIEGRDIDLSSRHTMLYDKYRTKYSQP